MSAAERLSIGSLIVIKDTARRIASGEKPHFASEDIAAMNDMLFAPDIKQSLAIFRPLVSRQFVTLHQKYDRARISCVKASIKDQANVIRFMKKLQEETLVREYAAGNLPLKE